MSTICFPNFPCHSTPRHLHFIPPDSNISGFTVAFPCVASQPLCVFYVLSRTFNNQLCSETSFFFSFFYPFLYSFLTMHLFVRVYHFVTPLSLLFIATVLKNVYRVYLVFICRFMLCIFSFPRFLHPVRVGLSYSQLTANIGTSTMEGFIDILEFCFVDFKFTSVTYAML
jgi:hypothetical protein